MAKSRRSDSYLEQFPHPFSVQHKITEETEKKWLHLHEQLELIVAVSDNMSCQYESGHLDIPAGSILLLDSLSPHYIYRRSPGQLVDRYVLYFSSAYISRLSLPEFNLLRCFYRSRTPLPGLVQPSPETLPALHRLLDDMIQSSTLQWQFPPHSSDALAYEMQTRFLLGQFLVQLNQLYFHTAEDKAISATSEETSQVLFIKDYIQEHYGESLRIEELSRQFFISKTQLYRAFHAVLGVSIGNYILQVRLIKARDLLRNSDYSIEMIAEKVGYQNLSAFSRAFKANTGVSPHAFRKGETR